MKNSFQQIDSVAAPRWKRNAFDLSHYKRMSANQGELIPTLVLEGVPGDSFQLNQEILTRFSPLLSPVYEDIDLITHFFKIPYYMVMRRYNDQGGWEDFLTGDAENKYSDVSVPQLEITDTYKSWFYEGTLADYLGYPVTDSGTTIHANAQITVNLFRALAYRLVFDQFYRDQNLQDDLEELSGSPGDTYIGGTWNPIWTQTVALFPSRPKPVNWEKDYFTSALPYAHDPNNTSVEYDLDTYGGAVGDGSIRLTQTDGTAQAAGAYSAAGSQMQDSAASNLMFYTGLHTSAVATLEIMELRRTEALFRWYEAQNRGGHRYEEHMLSVYGVQVKRPRNTPIYLGGNRQKIVISEVLSQTETLDNAASGSESITQPLGGFGGRSVSYGKTKNITTYCDEHCVILGLTMIRPRSTIGWQGVNRHVTKLDREDWFIPHLQGIGDQSILNKELYWDMPDSTSGLPDQVFGYAPRYSEYKFEVNSIHADMRSSLNFWHCARTFTDTPSLNETFIKMSYSADELHRIHVNTTTSDDKLWLFVHNYVRAIRPMRKYDYGQ